LLIISYILILFVTTLQFSLSIRPSSVTLMLCAENIRYVVKRFHHIVAINIDTTVDDLR